MPSCRNYLLLLWFLGLIACSDDGAATPEAEDGGARLLALSGQVFRLGSYDAMAAPEECPGWTRFRHDIRMDGTEMTQAEFAALLGRNPSTFRGDSLPVTDVSWYDAVLAANARSRRDGLDTVYEYAGVSGDAQGNATALEGLAIHLDRSGWRLPTEAEWEAAARAGTSKPWSWGSLSDSDKAVAYAWYQTNSGGRAHPVGSKSPNAWGLYDMAGNVMEWVNDWKGSFPADTVEEFAGQESPGDVPDVPLKGGSYNYGLSQLRPSSRTATYAAYRSSRAEYVGFRLCRGGFAARYASASGAVVYTPPVALVRADVGRFAGSWEARLVFVNRANGKGVLTWIDYGEPNPVARSLPDKDPVFHPVISPDGRWVAWSTALEGSTGASRIKARRLAKNDTAVLDLGEGAIPRWWVSGADTFLIAGDARDDLSSGWPGTKTIAWRWSNGVLASPSTWSSEGSYHDGRSGPYLYTGYRRLRQYDTRSGTSRILFTAPLNGKASGDTSQVCNVSAAPDSSGRSLFLDFGYTGTSSIVKRPYGIHEIAFVADSTGRVAKTIPSPSGEAQWEHMEWSNASKWAVSGAIDGSGAYRNLYLVDLDNAISTRIVSGEQLWQPALWVGESVDAPAGALDSASAYDRPEAGVALSTFAAKAVHFWKSPQEYEMVFVGSSRTNFGIDTKQLHLPAFNFGVVRGEMYTQDRLLRDYILPQCPKLKAVGLCLMPGWLWEYYTDYAWDEIGASLGYRFDMSHGFWKSGIPRWFRAAVDAKRGTLGALADSSGNMPLNTVSWGEGAPVLPPNSESFTDVNFVRNWKILEQLVADLHARGIVTILINFPVSPAYANSGYEELYGPTDSTFRKIETRIHELESTYGTFHYYDANRHGAHDYTDSMAMDQGHISSAGAILLTRRIDSLLVKWGM